MQPELKAGQALRREPQASHVESRGIELRGELLDERVRSPPNRCSTTPISWSWWNGTSTCGSETTFTDTFEHAGQRTASPSEPSPGASRKNADVQTGRGVLGVAEEAPRPLAGLDAARGEVPEPSATASIRDVMRFRKAPAPSPSGPSRAFVVCDEAEMLLPAPARGSARGNTAGCAAPGSRVSSRPDS